MRSTLALALHAAFALLAVACGGSSSSSLGDAGSGDGGGGGCGDPPPFHCTSGCNGATTSAVCVNGSWTCPPEPEIECPFDAGSGDDSDASAYDAGPGDGGIDCMGLTCNAATQYCDIRGGGAQLPDAGSNMTVSCPNLPTMPCDAGTGCACIPNACSCTDDGGAIKNECLAP